jgi:hypothetical protein
VTYYLSEIARILAPGGVAFTSWLLFDREAFPFLPDVYSLHVDAADFALAALFDREWVLEQVRRVGLCVTLTVPPPTAGHQWGLLLARRTPGMRDQFPLGADGAEWLAGSTLKAAAPGRAGPVPVVSATDRPEPPALTPVLAELDQLRGELNTMKRTWAWAIGRAVTSPVRRLRRLF